MARSYTPGGPAATSRASRRAGRPLLALALAILTACGGDSPTDPGDDDREDPPPTHRVEVIAGDGQSGFPGQVLPDSVRVRLVGVDGTPVAGRALEVSASSGGRVSPGRVVTGFAGEAAVRWRLGTSAGPHVLRVRSTLASETLEVAAALHPFPAVDALALDGLGDDDPVGALVDGRVSLGPVDDFGFVGRGPVLALGDWRSEDGTGGELLAFVPGRAMLHRTPPGFTDGPDTLRLGSAEPAPVDLTVRLAIGGGRAGVEAALVTAARIFEDEGLGVTLRSVEFVEDVAVDAALFQFTCSMKAELEEQAGRTERRINVYVVETVDGAGTRGQACRIGGDFVVLGRFAGPTLLAHELGHNLSLIHVDANPDHFDQTNVMHSASDTRESFSEGQIVRAQLNEGSVLNLVYGYRDPSVLRACYDQTSARCPATQLRLWADGPFGPWPAGAGSGDAAPGRGPAVSTAEEDGLPGEILETCGLEQDAAADASPGGSAPLPDPARLRTMLEEGPPARLRERWREAARLRARENARWLAERPDPPGWLSGTAADTAAAAADADARLSRIWREGLVELLARTGG